MVRDRKDWCISRQRKWGVPIPIFYCKDCGEPLIDKEAMLAVAELFGEEGSNAWFSHDASDILPEGTKCSKCGCTDFDKEKDIMDVWFDSGSSHTAVVKRRDYLKFPADLYLEGNDQYRGWFQSSLLTSVATAGVAPYKTVLTHGMILDMEKRKMSKSLGNGISPQEVIKQYGADVLRLWVASCDYQTDVNISFDILKQTSESYRKIRNTARYILGNLFDFDPDTDMVPLSEVNAIDKWALLKLNSLIDKVKEAYDKYEFHIVYHSIHNFCVVDMSNFYLDVLKDRLYTEKADSKSRKAAQTSIYLILNAMTRMIAPILAYTSDEIWKYMPHSGGDKADHVIFNDMPKKVDIDPDEEFMSFWDEIHNLRDDVKKTIEPLVKEKKIKGSLESKVTLSAGKSKLDFLKKARLELKDAFIVSELEVKDNGAELEISVEKADGEKCERCWSISKTVGQNSEHPTLCARCCENLK
jgi:isoleucyl-tRNA synthetase